MTYGNGAVVSYEYDNLDRVTYESWNGTRKYQYFYDAEGNLSKNLDMTNGKAVNYEYDSLGRLIHSYQSDGSSIVQKTEHLYDTENRIRADRGTVPCLVLSFGKEEEKTGDSFLSLAMDGYKTRNGEDRESSPVLLNKYRTNQSINNNLRNSNKAKHAFF